MLIFSVLQNNNNNNSKFFKSGLHPPFEWNICGCRIFYLSNKLEVCDNTPEEVCRIMEEEEHVEPKEIQNEFLFWYA